MNAFPHTNDQSINVENLKNLDGGEHDGGSIHERHTAASACGSYVHTRLTLSTVAKAPFWTACPAGYDG